ALALAALVAHGGKLLFDAGVFWRAPNRGFEACAERARITGAEDMEWSPGIGQIIVSADFRPAAGEVVTPSGAIYGFDPSSKAPASRLSPELPFPFHPHGIALWETAAGPRLFVINHRPEMSTIEIFSWSEQRFRHEETLADPLLITPNESLSRQHIDEFRKSGILATRYEDANAGGLLASASGTAPVIVLEITKLTDKKRGSGQSVSVAEFEAFGLVLVDEGHRGASGDEWRKLRGAVGKNALTLEYSATFGQIVNGATGNTKVPQLYGPDKTVSKKAMLLSEYAAAILFDFSYPHFYTDGYGKDYAILNADADDTNDTSDWILLANLLSYYEQSIAYAADPNALRAYNIERPLWILVGNSVTGGKASREEEVTLSDVQTVVGFFARFLAGRATWEQRIQAALGGDHALKDGNGRDLLAHRFS
ncbi:hypothetical protein EON81_27785, partial [bacterium]